MFSIYCIMIGHDKSAHFVTLNLDRVKRQKQTKGVYNNEAHENDYLYEFGSRDFACSRKSGNGGVRNPWKDHQERYEDMAHFHGEI